MQDESNPSHVLRGSSRPDVFWEWTPLQILNLLAVAGALVFALVAGKREYTKWQRKRMMYHKLDDDLLL